MEIYEPGNLYPQLRKNRQLIPSGFLLTPNNILVNNNEQIRRQFKNYALRGRLYNRFPKKQEVTKIVQQPKPRKTKGQKVPVRKIVGTRLLNEIIDNTRKNDLVRQLRKNVVFRRKIKQIVQKRPDLQVGGVRRAYNNFLDEYARYKMPRDLKNRLKHILNFKWISPDNLEEKIRSMHREQVRGYLLNLSFCYVLQKLATDTEPAETKIFFARDNNTLFEYPLPFISNDQDLENILQKIRQVDVIEFYRNFRPNSKWQFKKLLDYSIIIYDSNYAIGSSGAEIPDWLKFNKNIACFKSLQDDNLCFFYCLSSHLLPHKRFDHLKHNATKLFHQAYNDTNPQNFPGIHLDDLDQLENIFKINVLVYTADTEKHVTLMKVSRRIYKDTLHLLMTPSTQAGKLHFSRILDLEKLTNIFKCGKCRSFFKQNKTLEFHMKTCTGEKVKYQFKGGNYERKKNIFETLEMFGINVPNEDRFFPYFICFDAECFFKFVSDKRQQHQLVSISVNSNVPNLGDIGKEINKPKCFVADGDTENDRKNLVERVIYYLKFIQSISVIELQLHYKYVFRKLAALKKTGAKVDFLYAKFSQWIEQLPVVGFNSSF
jgi:hypothetical protein